MARYPEATWRPLPENETEPVIDPTQIILHTAVDAPGPTSLFGYFSRADCLIESHFFIKFDGEVEQYMSTTRQADANYHASVRAVSIETEDDGDPVGKPWTAAQCDSLVDLMVWLIETHPKILARECPEWDRSGIGWHAMWGAPSEWTPVAGKTCPGSTRIRQIPALIARVVARLEGDEVTEQDKADIAQLAARAFFEMDGDRYRAVRREILETQVIATAALAAAGGDDLDAEAVAALVAVKLAERLAD